MSRKDQLIKDLQSLAAAEKAKHFKETDMPDDPNKTGRDRQLISLEQEHEVRSWCESLDCTQEQLQEAVKAVGHSAEKVTEYLKTRR